MRVRGSKASAAISTGVRADARTGTLSRVLHAALWLGAPLACAATLYAVASGALEGRASAGAPFDDSKTPGAARAITESVADAPAPGDPQAAGPGDAQALSAAVKPAPAGPPVEWADSNSGPRAWTAPRLAAIQRVASRYEPHVDFQVRPRGQGSEARVQVAFGQPDIETRLVDGANRLGIKRTSLAERKKGRYFLFAAAGSDAVGFNVFRGNEGELRRAGWSAEKIAATGDSQVGAGWRKGPVQASIGWVQREFSSWGHTGRERFFGFTFSIRPPSLHGKRQDDTLVDRGSPYAADHRR